MLATLLLSLLPVLAESVSLQPIRMSHLGVCPNQLNPNLWVDAQSTCERECHTDQVRAASPLQAQTVTLALRGPGLANGLTDPLV